MEAARHFQDREELVRALEDRLVIERLTIEDERAARVVRERAEAGQSPADTVVDAIEIGARVLEREGLVGEVDYVRSEFERTSSEARELLAERSRDIAERITKSLEESRGELVRHLSSEDGRNPLADFKGAIIRSVTEATRTQDKRLESMAERMGERLGELHGEMVRLTEQAEAKRQLAEVEERGTAKGRTFEEKVYAAIERIAEGRGDCAHHVGDERGEGGGKQGDVVVEIEAADAASLGRIVFEVKSEKLSKNVAWKVLNESMVQRSAEFAVLVVAGDDRVPSGRDQLHEYEGNKLIVAVDPEEPDALSLEVAYRLARCRVLMARDRSLEVDAAGVRDAAEEAISALRSAQKIKLALTGAADNVDKARAGVEEMTAAVRERLERIDALVSAAATEDNESAHESR